MTAPSLFFPSRMKVRSARRCPAFGPCPANDRNSLVIGKASNDSQRKHADRLAKVFPGIAANSGNRFRAHLVERIKDRFHPLREIEPEFWPDAPQALAPIERTVR